MAVKWPLHDNCAAVLESHGGLLVKLTSFAAGGALEPYRYRRSEVRPTSCCDVGGAAALSGRAAAACAAAIAIQPACTPPPSPRLGPGPSTT